jgi:hypothetical protein
VAIFLAELPVSIVTLNVSLWHKTPIAQKAQTVAYPSNDDLPRSQIQRFTQYVKRRLTHKEFIRSIRALGSY